jgi:hypothetical protein
LAKPETVVNDVRSVLEVVLHVAAAAANATAKQARTKMLFILRQIQCRRLCVKQKKMKLQVERKKRKNETKKERNREERGF